MRASSKIYIFWPLICEEMRPNLGNVIKLVTWFNLGRISLQFNLPNFSERSIHTARVNKLYAYRLCCVISDCPEVFYESEHRIFLPEYQAIRS